MRLLRALALAIAATLLAATAALGHHCQPQEPPIFAPAASLQGPCGDPIYRPVFKNSDSELAAIFRWRYVGVDGLVVVLHRSVAPGDTSVGPWRHVQGRTRMTVKAYAAGEGSVVLVDERSARGGVFYGPCRVRPQPL